MQSKAATFEKFLAELPAEKRSVIRALDKIVRTAAPKAKCTMRFGMPTYDLADRFMALNSQKNYFSFYADPVVVKRHRGELKGLDCGKSCIRFRSLEDAKVPVLSKIARETFE
jgi:uncharacterized protein YdhG (YjbR/CyaY superfamily)